ncbi:GNAT family N-acetyltransferase [Paenibacillus thermotolerans]|uniref:GNAT family N-acetyltransferase n=1 Tax=Paenibacillus thermotolerans TaxID=3027807 RepID=UPI002368DE77|nr:MULTISPECIES: GNAT family N-acetyltransferase [unclassified Paenibacillus]
MKYKSTLDGITPTMLDGFFVGWPNPPSANKLFEILSNSYKFVLAIDEKTDKVIGFITAISDGVLSAYIPLLEVLPYYQKQGIGSEMVKRLLQQLSDIYMVDLICDENLQEYYERLGLKKANGMIIRNFANQSGR